MSAAEWRRLGSRDPLLSPYSDELESELEALDAADLRKLDDKLGKAARVKLTGNYAEDARELRRGRQTYWELHGGAGGGGKASASPPSGESERINLERVSQRLLLERQDLESKIAETRREFGKLARRKLVLEEEWKKLHVLRANLEEDKRRFQSARRSPWFQSALLPTADLRRVKLVVGGQLFETTEKVLKRDPGSLFAALVGPDSPLKPDEHGCFVIDRDWFLFRHILGFLRDGVLPQSGDAASEQLVSQLYKEAEFYRLETLRCAVREYLDPFQIVEKSAAVPLSRLHKLEAKMLQSLRPPAPSRDDFAYDDALDFKAFEQKNKAAPEPKKSEWEWWDKSRYKGNEYLQANKAEEPDFKWRRKGTSLEAAKKSVEENQSFTNATTWLRR
jgi:hypothetical protein